MALPSVPNINEKAASTSGSLVLGEKFTLAGLFALPLVISVGPRFELLRELPNAHLRLQDFLVPPVFIVLALFLMLNPRRHSTPRLIQLLLWASALGALTALLAVINASEGIELLIRLGFLYRLAVLPMTAFVVYFGLRSQGDRGLSFLGAGFAAGLSLNFGWFFWQVFIGQNYEAWRFTSESPWNWGVVTIGEGASFPSSQYVVLAMIIALSGALVTKDAWLRMPLAALSVGLCLVLWLTQSRASIASGAAVTALALYFLLRNFPNGTRSGRFAVLGFIGAGTIILSSSILKERFSLQSLTGEFGARSRIWYFYLQKLDGEELFGLGPGGPLSSKGGEAHNLYVFFLRDYGAAGLIIFGLIVAFLALTARKNLGHTTRPVYQAVSFVVLFSIVNLLVSGFAQDSLNPVISSHLLAVTVGALLWIRQGLGLPLFPAKSEQH